MSVRMLILTAAAILVPAVAASAETGTMRSGKAVLTQNCAGCHAIGATGASPRAEAPPFRDVVKRYPPEDLEESLAEGIVTGHPDMPEIQLTPAEISGVIAYLDALSVVTEDGGG